MKKKEIVDKIAQMLTDDPDIFVESMPARQAACRQCGKGRMGPEDAKCPTCSAPNPTAGSQSQARPTSQESPTRRTKRQQSYDIKYEPKP